jgi:integrase
MIQKLHLKSAGERIGIKGLGWHAFRHSYRGLLDESGANAGMQKGLMRHANISTTMNTYGPRSWLASTEARIAVSWTASSNWIVRASLLRRPRLSVSIIDAFQ